MAGRPEIGYYYRAIQRERNLRGFRSFVRAGGLDNLDKIREGRRDQKPQEARRAGAQRILSGKETRGTGGTRRAKAPVTYASLKGRI